jgi:hypothetical protein
MKSGNHVKRLKSASLRSLLLNKVSRSLLSGHQARIRTGRCRVHRFTPRSARLTSTIGTASVLWPTSTMRHITTIM